MMTRWERAKSSRVGFRGDFQILISYHDVVKELCIPRQRGARRPLAFATVTSSFFCHCSTTTAAQSVASYAFIPTNNVPSSATLSRAYTALNKNKKPFTPPWHHRRLQQQQRNLISTSSLYDGTNNPSNDRERIGNENIFFIEVGFGNDSHGQVSVFNAHLYIACFPIIPCVLKKMSYIICTPSCFLSFTYTLNDNTVSMITHSQRRRRQYVHVGMQLNSIPSHRLNV